jgi:DNA-binding beta-propeller fold protein YncE
MNIMKVKSILYLLGLSAVLLSSACAGDENEPMPQSTVSRLYVSANTADASILIFDPADGADFPEAYSFNSLLPDAQGILFDPYSGTVFQLSRQNRNVKTFTVKTDGTLTAKNSFIDESLASPERLAFDRSRNILYISSSADSSIYVYASAASRSGAVTADKEFKLDGEPRDIYLDNDRLFVIIGHKRAEVQLFEAASSLVSGAVDPVRKITLTGAKTLEGICYSPVRDALILSGTRTIDASPSIYIIEGTASQFARDTAINATRTITGPATGLDKPVDISMDEREGRDLIYIAESAGKKILTFPFSGNGNLSPLLTHSLTGSPRAIFLDAR